MARTASLFKSLDDLGEQENAEEALEAFLKTQERLQNPYLSDLRLKANSIIARRAQARGQATAARITTTH